MVNILKCKCFICDVYVARIHLQYAKQRKENHAYILSFLCVTLRTLRCKILNLVIQADESGGADAAW